MPSLVSAGPSPRHLGCHPWALTPNHLEEICRTARPGMGRGGPSAGLLLRGVPSAGLLLGSALGSALGGSWNQPWAETDAWCRAGAVAGGCV